MKRIWTWTKIFLLFALALGWCACTENQRQDEAEQTPIALILHGGAGYMSPENIPEELAQSYRDTLHIALETGYSILELGGTATDAVQAAIQVLEDCSLFNAGRGAVYNHQAQQEMDASIMDGQSLNTGAVAGVRSVKNPIAAARLVMDSSVHVMLSGMGADRFAREQGLTMADSSYFYNEKHYKAILKRIQEEKLGTVGAVALDRNGNIAAATSTGGMSNKKWNRIGDSPIIGAGTYANNKSCGISCTGTGEYFIRTVAAHEVSSLMRYQGLSLDSAIHQVLFNQIDPLGGLGGMIGIDRNGHIAWDFNTAGMFRAYRKGADEQIKLFGK